MARDRVGCKELGVLGCVVAEQRVCTYVPVYPCIRSCGRPRFPGVSMSSAIGLARGNLGSQLLARLGNNWKKTCEFVMSLKLNWNSIDRYFLPTSSNDFIILEPLPFRFNFGVLASSV